MATKQPSQFDIDQLLSRFPGSSAIGSNACDVEAFRSLCEDFALARTTLSTLEPLQGTNVFSRIAECRELVAELGNETTTALEHAKRSQ